MSAEAAVSLRVAARPCTIVCNTRGRRRSAATATDRENRTRGSRAVEQHLLAFRFWGRLLLAPKTLEMLRRPVFTRGYGRADSSRARRR
jgi:hypothetical protein